MLDACHACLFSLGRPIYVGEEDSGSHPGCILLWLPHLTDSWRHSGREVWWEMGAGCVCLSVNCQHSVDTHCCSSWLYASHHSPHSLWHRIGRLHLFVVLLCCSSKGKGPVVAVVLLSYTRSHKQKCFTISEVAADWHELMILQDTTAIHCLSQRTVGLQPADIPLPHLAILGLRPIACRLLLIFHSAVDRRLS